MSQTIDLPRAAGAVIIGGGVLGCSAAYHLAKAGIRGVVLLERAKLTSGTTWHSAAQVRTLRMSAALTALISYGVSLYDTLESEVGQATGWKQTGSLTIAASADRMVALRRMAALAQVFGVEAQVLSPAEANALWPEMRTDDLHGAVLLPGDGRVNPSDLCAALVKGFKMNGGLVVEGVSATGIRAHNGRVSAVETPAGVIETGIIVNCGGLWGREIGALAGVNTPLHACEHFYVITKPFGVPPERPTLGYPDGHIYMRAENGGMLVGSFEPRGKALPMEKLPKGFEFGLLPDDWDHFAPMLENAIARVPALEHAEIRTFLNGPESFTFDDRFHIGEAPGLRGFFVGCGMNSVGVASAGGVGRALAEIITEGRSSLDLSISDIKRTEQFHNNLRVLRDRVPETLGLHYAIPFPGREYETVRNLKRSPFHDRLAALGARFGQRAGWERPLWFAPDKPALALEPPLTFGKPGWLPLSAAEHKAAREAVVLIDQTPLGKFVIKGKDASAFLDRICCTNTTLPVGRLRYSLMLDEAGFIISDPVVLRTAEQSYLLVTGALQASRDYAWLERCVDPDERVAIVDITSAYAVLAVMGPNARILLSRLTDSDLSNENLGYGHVREIDVGYATVLAARVSYVGTLGWELYVPTEWALTLFDAIVEAGQDLGLRPAGLNAVSSLRIEKGNRSFGHDMGPSETPQMAGLGKLVSMRKQSFIGQKAVRAANQEPPSRTLTQFILDDPAAYPLGDEPILWDGKIVGTTTSAAFGHSVGRAVAMGYVNANGAARDADALIGRFEIVIAGERYAARAGLQPAYDPEGLEMRK